MDVATLTAFLAPCLPFLLKRVAAPALDNAASKIGEDAWRKAKAVWTKLRPRVELEKAAKVAANKLADNPESTVWKAAFEEELSAILQKEPNLSSVIVGILEDVAEGTQLDQVQQIAETNQGQMIGQMYGGEAKNVGNIGAVQGDVNL